MTGGVGTQLRGWDAATFRTASSDPMLRSTVVALTVFERAPDWERLRARMERLTRLVPVLRMRPLYGAIGFSAPRLAIDPDFDLDVHLRRYRLPEGDGWAALLDDARRMSLTDFDQHRPLWEVALVEGLPEGKAAMLFKLHHSIADGQATVLMALSLFERQAETGVDESAPPEPPIGEDVGVRDVTIANLADSLRQGGDLAVGAVRGVLDLARGTLTDPARTWGRALSTVASIGKVAAVPDAALSPVMHGRGTTYHFATMDFAFADFRTVARANSVNVNDVFLAAVSTGMDAYHRRHGVIVEELRINLPISLREGPGDRSGQAANAVSIARFPLPIANLDLAGRLRAAHELVASWKAEPAMHLADPLAEVSWLVPVPMLAQAARASDITTSNVPGPPIPLYLAGARLLAIYPLVATIGAAVNITMVTYAGRVFVGISADDRAVPFLDELVGDMRQGFEEALGVGHEGAPMPPNGSTPD